MTLTDKQKKLTWDGSPWAHLRDEGQHGSWSDFAAWDDWMHASAWAMGDEYGAAWEEIDHGPSLAKTTLYAVMFDAVALTIAKQAGEGEG